jgi:hypothetical protein
LTSATNWQKTLFYHKKKNKKKTKKTKKTKNKKKKKKNKKRNPKFQRVFISTQPDRHAQFQFDAKISFLRNKVIEEISIQIVQPWITNVYTQQ